MPVIVEITGIEFKFTYMKIMQKIMLLGLFLIGFTSCNKKEEVKEEKTLKKVALDSKPQKQERENKTIGRENKMNRENRDNRQNRNNYSQNSNNYNNNSDYYSFRSFSTDD